jgi:hypothetical protein
MAGSVMPIVVSHGEGRAEFRDEEHERACVEAELVWLRYLDNRGRRDRLSGQSQRFAGRDRRPDLGRRPRDHRHAAPGAGVPERAAFLAAGSLGRGQPVDAAVPQRARLDRLGYDRGAQTRPGGEHERRRTRLRARDFARGRCARRAAAS